MKTKKHIFFSFFFLFAFLASFATNSYCALSKDAKNSAISSSTHSVSNKQNALQTENNFLFEENEDENEFHFLLNFTEQVFAFTQSIHGIVNTFTPNKSDKKTARPIYISSHNFRI